MPSSQQQQVGMLQFLVSCAARPPHGGHVEEAAPVTLRDALHTCVAAARKPPKDVTPLERRLLAAVLSATAAGQAWLRPALRRELNTEVLLFLHDCFVYRAAAMRTSAAIANLTPAPVPRVNEMAAMSPLECIAEARTSAMASEATVATHAPISASASFAAPPLPPQDTAAAAAAAAAPAAPAASVAVVIAGDSAAVPPKPIRCPDTDAASHLPAVTGTSADSPPSATAVSSLEAPTVIMRRLIDTMACLREIEFLYLQPFSSIKMTFSPPVAAQLALDVKASRATIALLQSYVRVGFRAVPLADTESRLGGLRHLLDTPAADALADLADGVVLQLLEAPRANRLLGAAASIAQSFLAMRLHRHAAPPLP